MGEDGIATLFEDAHLLAVAKAPGVLTQGARLDGEAAVRRHLAPDDPGSAYLGTVHRLDRPVSGVLLWAKTPKAARRLADGFARREARKSYWAAVEGIPGVASGTWDDFLCVEDTGLGRVQVVRPETPRARRALTRWAPPARRGDPEGSSWLDLAPETGRTHQLRVQAAARGTPILGDRAYGARDFPGGIALHARSLTVVHPVTRQSLTFEADLPPSWAEAGLRPPP